MPSVDVPQRPSAKDARLTELYKFCGFTGERRNWALEILRDHKVYFSRPSELDDPNDLRPLLRFKRSATEAETRKILLAEAERIWARQIPPRYTEAELAGFRERIEKDDIGLLERAAIQRIHNWSMDQCSIFCLATSRGDARMWDRYADAHNGVCIHFRCDGTSPFTAARQVAYQAQRPTLDVPFAYAEGDVLALALLTKTMRWRGQAEYRLLRFPGVDYADIGMRFDGPHGYFPPAAISGITVGHGMSKADVGDISALADAHDPPIPVWRPTEITTRTPDGAETRKPIPPLT